MSENTIPPTDGVSVQAVVPFEVAVSMPPRPYATDIVEVVVGPPGQQGPKGDPGTGMRWRGVWSPTTAYDQFDGVAYVGTNGVVSSYVSEQPNTNQPPAEGGNTAYWTLFAQEGPKGDKGDKGDVGNDGLGVPAGGATDQQLAKKSNADNDTQWVTPHEVPAGGVTGQVLSKKTGTDYDTQWTSVSPMPVYDECGSLTGWTQVGGTGTVSMQQVADSAAGGKVFRFVGMVRLARTGSLVPYDPNALYRIKYRVRQTVDQAGQSTFNAGLAGVAADGTTIVSSTGTNTYTGAHNVASTSSLTVAGGWQEFTGYVKGTAASGSWAPAPSPAAPGQMHQNTRYIRPTLEINHSAGTTATAEIDYVSLEIVPVTAVATGGTEVVLSGDGAGTPLSAALTGTRSGAWTVPTGDITVGDDTINTPRYVKFHRLSGAGDAWRYLVAVTTNGDLIIQQNKNGVVTTPLTITAAGVVSSGAGIAAGGNLLAAAGELYVGDGANGTARFITNSRLVGGQAVDAKLYINAATILGGAATLECKIGATYGQVHLSPAGEVVVVGGGVARPIPFATAANILPVTAPAPGAGVSVAVTFPTNRFTANPSVTVGGYSNGYTAASVGSITTTGCTLRLWNLGVSTIASTNVHWHAVQVLPTGMESSLMADEVSLAIGDSHTVVCHTEGCLNVDAPIELVYEDDISAVHCGVCRQAITDIDGA